METRSVRTLNLVGGWLCLDFANTLGMHTSEKTHEFLRSYFDLVEWSNYAGIISSDEKRRLLHKADKDPKESVKVLQQTIELREIIFDIFASIARNTTPPKNDMAKFNKKLSQMMKYSKIEFNKSDVTWSVKRCGDLLDGMLNAVMQSAFRLLTSKELNRVKICADERGCGWLFFDHSKNRSRRWCNMADCGNLAKQKRFYDRKIKLEV